MRITQNALEKMRIPSPILCFTVLVTAPAGVLVATASSQFDPYQNNGGLISAVAGVNYVVLASDSRMIGPGGYDILERDHLSSRIWLATEEIDPYDGVEEESKHVVIPALDGSLASLKGLASEAADGTSRSEAMTMQSRRVFTSLPPVFIGSAGCNADCEMLKRSVRADLRAAYYFSESQLLVHQVAILLGQTLYSRRGFPYYSFCAVAGLDGNDGKIYVYDAIGSSEQVAVASVGTGRELLQPILDRKFRSRPITDPLEVSNRMQSFGSIPPAQVDCSKEEAISILLEGYRAVAEREIGVGDQVAFCILFKRTDDKYECQLWTAPLKKH